MTDSPYEKQSQALRTLEAAGFDVKQLWRELTERESTKDRGEPSEDDKRYELPLECPRTESHLAGGNEVLAPGRLWNGLSYTLTAGQRGLLRDLYELTPTMTVTVKWVEPWPGTRYPYRMCLTSDLHVDNRLRRHVLTQVVVNKVGEFFRCAAERDVEEQKAEPLGEKMLTVGKVMNLASEHRWAVADLVGVSVSNKVEVVHVNPEKFTVVCLKTGNKATLSRNAFFDLVEEYLKLYRVRGVRRNGGGGGSFDATPALDALLATLE